MGWSPKILRGWRIGNCSIEAKLQRQEHEQNFAKQPPELLVFKGLESMNEFGI